MEGWQELPEVYAFLYLREGDAPGAPVLLKCLTAGDKLLLQVAAVGGQGERERRGDPGAYPVSLYWFAGVRMGSFISASLGSHLSVQNSWPQPDSVIQLLVRSPQNGTGASLNSCQNSTGIQLNLESN